LRLDLAGVDLLVPDIARSWRETGGGICEVNAQPQLSGHLPRSLLPKLVSRRGRIPVVVLIGLPDGWNARQGVVNDMHRHGVTLAWPDAPEDCRACLIRPDVQALVWPIKDMPGRHMAAPVDAVDLLVLFEPSNALTAELAAARMAWPDWARNAPTLWRVRATTGPQDAAISLSDLPERLLSFFLERTADRCES
jgi:hypothetical protein